MLGFYVSAEAHLPWIHLSVSLWFRKGLGFVNSIVLGISVVWWDKGRAKEAEQRPWKYSCFKLIYLGVLRQARFMKFAPSPPTLFFFFFQDSALVQESKEIQAGQVVLKAMTQVSGSFLYPWNNINICVLYPETSLSSWAPFSNLLPVPPLQRMSNDASPPFVALSSPSVHIRAQCSYQSTNGAEIYSPERNLRAVLIRTVVE